MDNLSKFQVDWQEIKNGKIMKLSRTFDTKVKRDKFMKSLPRKKNFVQITRFSDFEIIHTFKN